jgi:hypothetical protein
VWIERTNYFKLLEGQISQGQSVHRLAQGAYSLWVSLQSGNKTSQRQRDKSKVIYREKVKIATDKARVMINTMDWNNTVACFTCGEIDPTEKAVGAGVIIKTKGGDLCNIPVGTENNNKNAGGLYAIGVAMEHILSNLETGLIDNLVHSKVLVFSNCNYDMILHHAKKRSNDQEMVNNLVIELIQEKMELIRRYSINLEIIWSPDTNNCDENRLAHKLAVQGCLIASNNDNYENFIKYNTTDTLAAGSFLYPF